MAADASADRAFDTIRYMRLTRIKLSGFKSFVDPTTFQLPSQLIGIVGPNGCGKSNLIDAVRWVMGESSAKQLRGESMADVIFNGSTARKPVGQASIELVFDNSQGRLGGEYARYGEIAIRRLLSRDGQSTYFLNGTRCRRRDITDIFLGTGLGPRSYAIIEQGMISRVIEAGPEQLRAFLEEAAGISKYKERRRETENRIRHTRENLDRVNDLREEIEKQLERLQRQARNAERFKALKDEERSYRAGLMAMRWRNENVASAGLEREVAAAENEVQRITSEQRTIEAQLEQSRETLNTANDDLSQVQARFYSVGSEAARVEQAIRHQRELRQQRHDDLRRAETALAELRSHMHLDRAQIESISQFLDEHTPRLEALRSEETAAGSALADAESTLDDWRQQWEDAQTRLAEPQRTVEVERTRIDYHERQLMQLQERVERIAAEQRQVAEASSESTLPELERTERRIADELTSAESQVAELTRTQDIARAGARETAQALDAKRERCQRMQGRLSSLKTLQEAALRADDGDIQAWLDANGLSNLPRLGSELEVLDGWEAGVEAALDGKLDAVCVATLDSPAKALSGLGAGELTLVQISPRPAVGLGPDDLLTRVDGSAVPVGLLAGVRCRESVDQALADQRNLGTGEVFVTRDGTLVGRDWVRIQRGAGEGDGVLARGNEIETLEADLATVERSVQALSVDRDRLRAESEQAERARSERQAHLNALHRSLSEVRTELGTRRSQLEQQALRDSALATDLTDTRSQIDAERDTLRIARDRLQQSVTDLAAATKARESLEGRRAELHDSAEQARRQSHELSRQANQVALQVESKRSALESLTRSVNRQAEQVAELTAREGVLRAQVGEGDAPLASLEAQLKDLLDDRAVVEQELQASRAAVHECDGRLRAVDRERLQAEQGAQSARQALEHRRLAANEAQVRRQTVEEQMAESGLKPEQVLAGLPEDADLEAWHAELQRIETRIQRLGPINLAAIDEFSEQSERKRYLDAQHADLTEALDTLENAIAKIDRETRGRFKVTYDQVNDGLAELFPRLFGGGHAFLELAGDDLLSAGVSIMARPPGKRISNIHLLSGGEKALTAVALVFTIFRLNPAPFCMLDEVDAPLDEANVGRYCELVREMSEKVQFIVITHNKTTMEGVEQLVGVTMHEPGCSRLVSVDVEEAARLAAV
jgi:chromosome segregation protein